MFGSCFPSLFAIKPCTRIRPHLPHPPQADEAFDVVELSLREHPYFQLLQAQATAATTTAPDPPAAPAPTTALDPATGLPAPSYPTWPLPSSPGGGVSGGGGPTASSSSFSGAHPQSLPHMISAVRLDRASFMERVAECVKAAAASQDSPAWDECVMQVCVWGVGAWGVLTCVCVCVCLSVCTCVCVCARVRACMHV